MNPFFYGESAELFRSWIHVLYSQIYCKIWGWVNGGKLANHDFTLKNNFKNKHCWPFIFSITMTLYILNQCFFPEESVEPFRFRLWPIATALGALILTSLIFLQPSLVKSQRCFGCNGDLHHFETYFSFFNFPIVVPREKQIETMDFFDEHFWSIPCKRGRGRWLRVVVPNWPAHILWNWLPPFSECKCHFFHRCSRLSLPNCHYLHH